MGSLRGSNSHIVRGLARRGQVWYGMARWGRVGYGSNSHIVRGVVWSGMVVCGRAR